MRTLQLAQIAAQAEGLRWRRRAKRVASQIAFMVVAVPFLLAALGFLEVAFWNFVAQHFQAEEAALLVMAGNLLVVVLMVIMAMMRGGDDRVSLEALEVRRRALESAQRTVTMATMAGPATAFLLRQLRRSRKH